MGSLGFSEIAFIVIVALLLFGPKKLPEIGRTLGRGMAEFRRATDELKRTINTELALEESPVPPLLRTRRIEDPVEPAAVPPAIAPIPGEAPQMTEPRTVASFPAAAEAVQPEPAAAPGPVAGPAPDPLPEPPR